MSYPEHSLVGGILHLSKDAVSVFYSLSRQTYSSPLPLNIFIWFRMATDQVNFSNQLFYSFISNSTSLTFLYHFLLTKNKNLYSLIYVLKHKISRVLSANTRTRSHKNATNFHVRRNKIINKHKFKWIFFCNGVKYISLDHRYNLLSIIPPRNVEAKKFIIEFTFIISK